MTRAVTDDHLWRRGAAEELHYAPHSLIGRAMLGVSREVWRFVYSGNFCAWVSAAQETGTAGEFIGAAVPSLSYLKFLVISNAAALLCLSMS